MKIDLQCKNSYRLTDRLEQVITAKLNKLDKYFPDDQTPIKVVMSQDKGKKCKMEVSLKRKGLVIRSEMNGDTMYYIIDDIMPKLERQIVKHREKLIDKYQSSTPLPVFEQPSLPAKEEMADEYEVAKVKKFPIYSIEVKEAIEELEMVGHDFYIFVNSQTGNVECVYRRKDGKVGLLQPYHE